MKFKIYRDVATLRLRKIVLELYSADGCLVERKLVFWSPFLYKKLLRVSRGMLRRAAIYKKVELF